MILLLIAVDGAMIHRLVVELFGTLQNVRDGWK